jgi:inosose dehydratase
MQISVGSAPDSWGVWFPEDPRQTPWERYLDEVQSAGYEWTELGPYGYMPTDVKQLRGELDKRGLKVSASFVMASLEDPGQWGEVERQLLGTGEMLAQLGAKYLVLIDDTYTNLFTGEQKEPERLDESAWKRLVESSNKVGDIAQKRFGLRTVFHPHADTHVQYEDQIEKLIEDTDPALVAICLDTGHHAYRLGDPTAFYRKHHSRIEYLHLKSVDGDMRARVESEKIPFAVAVGMDLFCEPAQGAVDFSAFRDALRDTGYSGIVTVEQDMFPAPLDKPLPIAERTRRYLREIGIG